ncbi:hypothetical protein DPMN_043818 [Dreissena polymorpha]|uniref:Uncharacterized protein n=1 Tax=Dreissena polymorpha TaxID=45954 RepID=A0A9D4D168_DREPO|nr:hypothetical protein DPMN_043818 [Dreissena polymorpha]
MAAKSAEQSPAGCLASALVVTLATQDGFLHASFVGGQNNGQVWFSPGTPVFTHSTRPHQNNKMYIKSLNCSFILIYRAFYYSYGSSHNAASCEERPHTL